jgi:hypothetical protein
MTRDQILQSARKLEQPADAATAEFADKRDQLAAMASQTLLERPDLEKLIGPGNQQMAEDNNRNFARFMESMFAGYQPDVLVETVLWVFRAYRSHGFQTTYWATNLNIWVDLLKNQMSADAYQALYPFYHWLIVNIPVFVKLSDDAGQHLA